MPAWFRSPRAPLGPATPARGCAAGVMRLPVREPNRRRKPALRGVCGPPGIATGSNPMDGGRHPPAVSQREQPGVCARLGRVSVPGRARRHRSKQAPGELWRRTFERKVPRDGPGAACTIQLFLLCIGISRKTQVHHVEQFERPAGGQNLGPDPGTQVTTICGCARRRA